MDGVAVGELTENHAHQLDPGVIALAMLVGTGIANNFSDDFFG